MHFFVFLNFWGPQESTKKLGWLALDGSGWIWMDLEDLWEALWTSVQLCGALGDPGEPWEAQGSFGML